MRRRSLEVLGLARDEHGQLIATTGHPLLSDEDRRELRPVLRAYAVQRAALARSRWLWGYHALRLATAVCAVAVPVVALVIWVGGSETLWAALTSYLLFGAIALLGHGIQQNGAVKPYVTATVIAAVVAAVVTAVLAVFTGLWSGIASGIAAAGALLVLAEIRLFGLIAVRTAVVVPLAMRRAGWLLPPQLAAVHLLQLLDGLHRARSTCRHPRRRRNFLRWMGEWIDFVQWDLPRAAAGLRLGAAITTDARTRATHLAGRLRQLHVRLAHDHQLEEYDRVSTEAAALAMALARGDWSWVTQEDQTEVGPGRVMRALKKVVPCAVLALTAVALPYLPGVTASAAGLVGVQVGLVLAAALSLIPIEVAHRENVMSAYTNASRPNP
ncbi:hypothetical protein ACFPIJ_09785 [Dactylosporangium cerinum]|uniref:Integral membrane protein n=1 Tax=Dactylosporangium cerinum TaxID=1434730 RepID=A0ABV9VP07_9ACTN